MFTVWLPTAYSIDRPICQRRTVSGRPYQHFARNMGDGRLLYCALGAAYKNSDFTVVIGCFTDSNDVRDSAALEVSVRVCQCNYYNQNLLVHPQGESRSWGMILTGTYVCPTGEFYCLPGVWADSREC